MWAVSFKAARQPNGITFISKVRPRGRPNNLHFQGTSPAEWEEVRYSGFYWGIGIST